MAIKRPHFSSTGPQLQKLFEVNKHDPKVLREILAELKHRSTPTAQALRKEVESALRPVKGQASSANSEGESAAPPVPPLKTPTHQTLPCRGCKANIRVPIRPERTGYSCPTCKADFETNYKDGVLQVVWVEERSPPASKDDVMNEGSARVILGVSASADFSAIKAAWRRASQQYHPDKHQGLPERLRNAAVEEMKRINEAYRFLEGSTGSDF
jgi:hypothetical protein